MKQQPNSTTTEQKPTYEAKIKNITKDKWYGGTSKAGNPIHSKDEKDAVLFWDKDEAEIELIMLNDQLKDCYTLIDCSKPLWKVLNEQRTKGDWWWHSPIIKFPVHRVLCGEPPEAAEIAKFFTATMDNAEQQQANAQYTALAVNNLHILAEALAKFIDKATEHHSIYFNDELKTAKEALNKIS